MLCACMSAVARSAVFASHYACRDARVRAAMFIIDNAYAHAGFFFFFR